MKTLTRYIGIEVLGAILLIFIALVMLFAFFDLIHELSDVGKANYTLTTALLFVAMQLPSRMYELLPIAALIGTLSAMAQLVASSEYTVMRASGASLLQVMWALIRVGVPLAVATFLAGEFVAPPAERIAADQRTGDGESGGSSRNNFNPDSGSSKILRSSISQRSRQHVASNVRIYEFDRDLR
jgi:lipopolysaccharide export system permease protein